MPLPNHAVHTLPTRHLGRRMLVFPRLDSTNTLALTLASEPAQHGLVLLADEQTAGRGQYGRTWLAPPRSSVLLSLLLFPPPALRRPALLVAWAAVSVAGCVEALLGLPAHIKWPNDVLVAGKKVCGILIEQRNSGDAELPLATVVGIGLNVTQPAERFVAADLPLAGSLFSLSGQHFDTEAVARRLIEQLDDGYARLLDGDSAALVADWRERLGLLGQHVRVETAEQTVLGRLTALTLDTVQVETDAGAVVAFAPEVVRQIVAT